MATRLDSSCVLPPNYELTILVAGEAGVGKSSLINSFLERRQVQNAPPVVDPVLFRSDTAAAFGGSRIGWDLRRVHLKIVDCHGAELARSRDAIVRTVRAVAPDVVLLCYSHADPSSLARLASHWLPALTAAGPQKPGWPHVPVCLCGLKADLFDETPTFVWREALAATQKAVSALGGANADAAIATYGIHRYDDPLPGLMGEEDDAAAGGAAGGEGGGASMSPETKHSLWTDSVGMLMVAFPAAVEQCEVSLPSPQHAGGLLGELADTLHKAADLVMHPTFPLFAAPPPSSDEDEAADAAAAVAGQMASDPPGFAAAYGRMFRIYASLGSAGSAGSAAHGSAGGASSAAAAASPFASVGGGAAGALSLGLAMPLQRLMDFQRFSLDATLLEEEIAAVIDRMRRGAEEEGADPDALVEITAAPSGPAGPAGTGIALKLPGFRQLLHNFILTGDSGFVWQALRRHGYEFKPASASNLLTWDNERAAPPHFAAAAAAHKSKGAGAAAAGSARSSGSAGAAGGAGSASDRSADRANGDGTFGVTLMMPGELTHARCADSLGLAEDASLSLSRAGTAFLQRLFHATLRSSATAWSLDGSAPTTLEPAHLDAMFAPTPAGVHPFQRWIYPDVTHHNAHGGITEVGWLGLWRMLLATEPSTAFQALYALGFATRHGDVGPGAVASAGASGGAGSASAAGAAGSGCLVSCDPRAAVVCDKPRKASEPLTRTAVRRIFVVGSKGSGKSSVILHFICQGRAGLEDHIRGVQEQAASAASGGADAVPPRRGPAPTLQPTHYVAPPPSQEDSAEPGVRVAPLTDPERIRKEAALPDSLIITEWPADALETAMEAAVTQADAVLVVVALTRESLDYAKEAVEAIPDRVPCVVVRTAAPPLSAGAGRAGRIIRSAEEQETERAVEAELQALCDPLSSRTQKAGAGTGAVAVDSSSSGSADSAGSAASSAAPSAPGWEVELYDFTPRAREHESKDLFRFLALAALDPDKYNPLTAARRSRKEWPAKVRQIAAAVTVIAAVVGFIAYKKVPAVQRKVDSIGAGLASVFSSARARFLGR